MTVPAVWRIYVRLRPAHDSWQIQSDMIMVQLLLIRALSKDSPRLDFLNCNLLIVISNPEPGAAVN